MFSKNNRGSHSRPNSAETVNEQTKLLANETPAVPNTDSPDFTNVDLYGTPVPINQPDLTHPTHPGHEQCRVSFPVSKWRGLSLDNKEVEVDNNNLPAVIVDLHDAVNHLDNRINNAEYLRNMISRGGVLVIGGLQILRNGYNRISDVDDQNTDVFNVVVDSVCFAVPFLTAFIGEITSKVINTAQDHKKKVIEHKEQLQPNQELQIRGQHEFAAADEEAPGVEIEKKMIPVTIPKSTYQGLFWNKQSTLASRDNLPNLVLDLQTAIIQLDNRAKTAEYTGKMITRGGVLLIGALQLVKTGVNRVNNQSVNSDAPLNVVVDGLCIAIPYLTAYISEICNFIRNNALLSKEDALNAQKSLQPSM